MATRATFPVLVLAIVVWSNVAFAGWVTNDDSLLARGNPGCQDGTCPDGSICIDNSDCCGGKDGPAASGGVEGPPCAPTAVGDPIDMRNGNLFHRELLFSGGGEMPLEFELFYNSKHYIIANITTGRLRGRWSHTYSAHLIIYVNRIGLGDALVEVRRPDGQSLYFIEPDAVTLASASGAVDFSHRKSGNYGNFRGLGYDSVAQTYSGFEYERADGTVEVFEAPPPAPNLNPAPPFPNEWWLTSHLEEIRSVEGATHTLQRDCLTTPGECLVTVTRSLGGTLTYTYDDLPEDLGVPVLSPQEPLDDYHSDAACYRCPKEVAVSGISDPFEISTNAGDSGVLQANAVIDSLTYPTLPTESTATKTLLYAASDGTDFDGTDGTPNLAGCPTSWECSTALIGITDEENWAWTTWKYRTFLQVNNNSIPHRAWAYISYHGTALEDHVEFSQPSDPSGFVGGDGDDFNDKFIVTRNHGVREVYDLDHIDIWQTGINTTAEPNRVVPRVRSVRDIRSWDPSISEPSNVEIVNTFFNYYSNLDPPGETGNSPDKSGLLQDIVVEPPNPTTSDERYIYAYDYTPEKLVSQKREEQGPYLGTITKLRVTDYVWNTALRKPTRIVVSKDGVDLAGGESCDDPGETCEYEIVRTYTTEGRIDTITTKDYTDHTAPYTTNSRTRDRVVDYSYTYHDAGNTQVETIVVNGPRPDSPIPDSTTYEFTVDGFLTKVTDAEGNETTWTGHNVRGQPGTRTDPDQVATAFTYNPRGWLKQRSRNGQDWDYDYYSNGLLKRIDFPDGDYQAFEYTDARKLLAIENSFGDRIDFARTFETDGGGARTGNLTVVATVREDFGGPNEAIVATSTTKEDSRGRVYESSGANGQVTEYTYELTSRLKTIVQKGHAVHGDLTTTLAYDGIGRLTSIEYPLPAGGGTPDSVAFEYNLRNQVTKVTDARLLETEYRIDGFGDLIRLASPDSGTKDYSYDGAGNLLVDSQDLGGGITSSRTRTYDAANRLLTETANPENTLYQWEYDLGDQSPLANREGRLAAVTESEWSDGQGIYVETGSTDYGYDEFGRLDIVQKEIGHSSGSHAVELDYDFDAVGNLVAMKYPSGRTVNYPRTRGRITSADWVPPGSSPPSTSMASVVEYAPFGRIDGFTYGNGFELSRSQDTSQRLLNYVVSHTDGSGTTNLIDRVYGYDAFDQVSSITDNLSAPASEAFAYDERHRLDTASGVYGAFDYDYDPADNRVSRSLIPPGETVAIVETHIPATLSNRLDGVDTVDPALPDPVERRFVHDARGNIVEDRRSSFDVLQFEFDDRNRMASVRRKTVPEPGLGELLLAGLVFLLGLARHRNSARTAPASTIGLPRRRRNVVTAVVLSSIVLAGGAWAQDSDGDGIPDSFEIASQGHPTNLPLFENIFEDAGFDYDGDGVSNLIEYVNGTDIWDPLDCDTPTQTLCRPMVPVIESLTVDKDQIIDSGVVTISWVTSAADAIDVEPHGSVPLGDGSGSIQLNISQTTIYTLRASNANGSQLRHIEVEVFETFQENDYNALNQRVRRSVEGTERLFVYGPRGRLIAELQTSGEPVAEHVYLGDQPLAQIHGIIGAETTYFVHTSHLGAPEVMTDDARAVAWAQQRTPFGEQVGTESGVTQRTRFPGQFSDIDSGLSYNWHRYYDPTIARYSSSDPIGQLAGANTFIYAESNAVNFVDPYGLFSAWEATLAAGNFATGVADAASLGLGPLARDYLEDEFGAGGTVDECSDAYSNGELASLLLGAGRLAYAAAAKGVARFASSGVAASTARNSLKRAFRGGAAPNYRTQSAGSRLAEYGSDDALRAAAGRTNNTANAVGANLAIGGAIGTLDCGCESAAAVAASK